MNRTNSPSEDFSVDPLVHRGQIICHSQALEGYQGFRFRVLGGDVAPLIGMRSDPNCILPAFVVKKNQQVFAYLNRCAHLPMEMDWLPGVFFDENRTHLVCSTHHAVFEIDTGRCLEGPCPVGTGLIPLKVILDGQMVLFQGAQS